MIVSPEEGRGGNRHGEIGASDELARDHYAASAKAIQDFCATQHMNGDNLVRHFKFALTAG